MLAFVSDSLAGSLSGRTASIVLAALDRYRPADEAERADSERVRRLVASVSDPWSRSEPLHLTASALVVDPASNRPLLRWHERLQRFQQVGGHGDPGEEDPLSVALREAAEETGLRDLRPCVRSSGLQEGDVVHVAVVQVPAGAGEDAHEHADVRYLLETAEPHLATPENPRAELRWLTWEEAFDLVTSANLRRFLLRSQSALG